MVRSPGDAADRWALAARLRILTAWEKRHSLRRRPALWRQVVLIVFALWLYDRINAEAPTRLHAADVHGSQVLSLERHLHIAFESGINAWVLVHPIVANVMDYFYLFMQFAVVAALLLWAYLRHPSHYRPLRDALFLTNIIGFAVFWTYPTTPPRLLPAHHYVDTIAHFNTLWSWDSGVTAKTANLYAAMPSLHAAYAVWVALFIAAISAPLWARALAWSYVVATAVVIMGTGNHYLLDAVAGVLTAVVAYSVANARDGLRLLQVTAMMSLGSRVKVPEPG